MSKSLPPVLLSATVTPRRERQRRVFARQQSAASPAVNDAPPSPLRIPGVVIRKDDDGNYLSASCNSDLADATMPSRNGSPSVLIFTNLSGATPSSLVSATQWNRMLQAWAALSHQGSIPVWIYLSDAGCYVRWHKWPNGRMEGPIFTAPNLLAESGSIPRAEVPDVIIVKTIRQLLKYDMLIVPYKIHREATDPDYGDPSPDGLYARRDLVRKQVWFHNERQTDTDGTMRWSDEVIRGRRLEVEKHLILPSVPDARVGFSATDRSLVLACMRL